MKKLLIMVLMASVIPFGMSYGANIAANGSASSDFSLSHIVTRISTFTTKTLASDIINGANIISRFSVENNTSDGYKVNIKSTSLGVMVPASTDDGEANITYVLTADKLSGEVGAGMDVAGSIDLSAATGTDLIKLGSGAEQTTATDASYKFTVTVDAANAMTMAGNYSDTLTVTYTDL
jgi:hypothetical protein